MSSPASKDRSDNPRAFAARNKTKGGVSERERPVRKSKYGARLEALRKRHGVAGEGEEE